MKAPIVLAALLGAAFLMTGCSPQVDEPMSPVQASMERERLLAHPYGKVFIDLGCAGCHGEHGPYHDKLRAAVRKPLSEVVEWIRDPHKKVPSTIMPAFAGTITDDEMRQLAAWVQRYARTVPPAPK